ncbi:hypothetical protein Pint_20380 [Pistacia integerrima]|uniref:Uncharacterized protein n=1 Tax=Pistacia integerrima TaxID=434235 RepID=A0ACC0X9V9_9ROSI|nr:hypothetical protein Pint_20380 [Pistacia integerrima]
MTPGDEVEDMISFSSIFVEARSVNSPSQNDNQWLLRLSQLRYPLFFRLYGINVCGEGGEYETLTLDCPIFVNARIVLDEFQVVLHSPDSIAPVGVLHPLKFHLESKSVSASLSDGEKTENFCKEKTGVVFEVQGDCPERCEATSQSVAEVTNLVEVTNLRLNISKTKKDNTFSICCWLQGPSKTSAANETYVKFITLEKCPFGVPSRSTIELPLMESGLGKAYIEVLVGKDQSKKKVLHVQSISCWAPSCIGPYSQATLHKEVLHMAGQLGLDPPTMTLCDGGPAIELEQALQNSEAVAKSFNCSISMSTIFFVIYCSSRVASSERHKIQDKLDNFLKQLRVSNLEGSMSKVLDPIFLYVLVSDLPKRALVEIKPILHVMDGLETESEAVQEPYYMCCVFKHHLVKLLQGSVPEARDANHKVDHLTSLTEGQIERLSQFCLYLLSKVIVENKFSWGDVMNLRLYIPTTLDMPMETLSAIFTSAFNQLAEVDQRVKIDGEPIFNLVPVLGAGKSAASMNDIITFELFAQRS